MNAPISENQKKDIAHALHPYTNLAAHEEQGPLVISRGEGVYVWDDRDNRYLEGLGGFGVSRWVFQSLGWPRRLLISLLRCPTRTRLRIARQNRSSRFLKN